MEVIYIPTSNKLDFKRKLPHIQRMSLKVTTPEIGTLYGHPAYWIVIDRNR